MGIKRGWNQDVAISTLTEEDGGVYGAGVATVDATTHTTEKGFLSEREWADEIVTDKSEVTGTEHGTDQEITEKRTGGTMTFPKGQAHWMGFYGAAVLGDITTTQDATNDGYLHNFEPVAEGTQLKSWQLLHSIGGQQRTFKGCKGGSLKISGEENGYISAEMVWMGDGSREKTSETYPAKPVSAWVPFNLANIFMENGAAISIASAPRTQGTQNISSGSPVTLNARVKSFEAMFNNNLEPIPGSGGLGLLNDIEYGRRTVELKLTMRFEDQTELDHYLAQDALALEINVKGGVLDSGAYFEGFILIIPRFKLKAPPLATGDPDSVLEIELEADVQDDGTNSAWLLDVYNATAVYLA